MPRIILKDKSPEFAELSNTQIERHCEMPGCPSVAEHKAPKNRGLDEYYYFCLDHAKEYNKAWNFFSGMPESEVQAHMDKSIYGDRPTWKYGVDGDAEEKIYRAAQGFYNYDDYEKQKKEDNQRSQSPPSFHTQTPEHEAMAIMGLSPPVTLDEIKTRYKTLAKKHHPDLNRNDPNAEELLKKINMSYTILKLAFEEYRKLPER